MQNNLLQLSWTHRAVHGHSASPNAGAVVAHHQTHRPLAAAANGAEHVNSDYLFSVYRSRAVGQCCESGLFIPDPTTTRRGGENKLVVVPFLVVINFTKLKVISFLNRRRKRFESIDKKFKYFKPKNLVDPGSHSNKHWVPDPQHWSREDF